MVIFVGCSPKEENIVFAAIIDEIHDNSLLVTTVDFDGFERANVGYGEGLEIGFNFALSAVLIISGTIRLRKAEVKESCVTHYVHDKPVSN